MKSKLGLRTVYLKTTYFVTLMSSSDKLGIHGSSYSRPRRGLTRQHSQESQRNRCVTNEILSQVQPIEAPNRRDGKRQLFAWLHREDFQKLSACAANPKDEVFRHWCDNYSRMEPTSPSSSQQLAEPQNEEQHVPHGGVEEV